MKAVQLRAERAHQVAVLEQLLTKAESEGRVLTADEQDQFDTIKRAIVRLDQQQETTMDTESPQGALRPLVSVPSRLSEGCPADIADQLTRSGRTSWEVKASLVTIARNIVGETLAAPPDVAITVQPTYRPLVDAGFLLRPTLLSLLPHVSVSGGAIIATSLDYTQPDNVGNKAAKVAEAALKPESDLVLASKSVTLETWAHTIRVTRQCLADIPALRQLLDSILIRGLLAKVDAALYTQLAAAATAYAPATGTNSTDNALLAAASLEALGGSSVTVLMNPADVAAGKIARCPGSGCYAGYPPGAPAIVPCPAVPVGQMLCFASQFGYFAEREVATVIAGVANDDFLKNLVRLLCEMRGALVVQQPRFVLAGPIAEAGTVEPGPLSARHAGSPRRA